MKEINLWDLSGAALIVPAKTGVNYTNQVDGTACDHRKLEGILIPINNDCLPEDYERLLETQLCSLFDSKWGWGSITEEKANEIDAVLAQNLETKGIQVNRSKINDSVESWVHVVAKEAEFSCYSGFGDIYGILTWPNSD